MNKHRYLVESFREYSDAELLSYIIGGESDRAQKIAKSLLKTHHDLNTIAQLSPHQLLCTPGLGKAVAIRLHAGLRAGRRALFPVQTRNKIDSAESAYQRLWPMMTGKKEESLWGLYVNRRKHLINQLEITRGNANHTIVDPKQIYYYAIHCNASGVILAHNHPSGSSEPSIQDLKVTERVATAGKILNIPLLDHLIIGDNTYCSLASFGSLTTISEGFVDI